MVINYLLYYSTINTISTLIMLYSLSQIWDSVPKPEAHKQTPLSDFFNVEVVALSSFEEKEEQFKEQV